MTKTKAQAKKEKAQKAINLCGANSFHLHNSINGGRQKQPQKMLNKATINLCGVVAFMQAT